MNKGSASTMHLYIRAVQKPYISAYRFLPAVVLWVISYGGCGCPESYTYFTLAPGDATNILIAIDQTGYQDQWATSLGVYLHYNPPEEAFIKFTVKNLGCQQGSVSMAFDIHVGDPRVRSLGIWSDPDDCPDEDAASSEVTIADIQCEIASTWDNENLVMSISIDYCEIEVLDMLFYAGGNTPSIQHVSIQGTHSFQMEREFCR